MNSNDSVMEVEWDEPERKPELLVLTERQRRNFDKKVDKSGGPDACWPWTASRNQDGYGLLGFGGRGHSAHRVAFQVSKGVIPPDKPYVLHTCDNPPCCNPAHLWAGTQKENADDRERKKRGNHASGAANGRSTMPERTARGLRSGAYTKPESVRRGESHGMSKLTTAAVIDIRQRYAAGGVTFRQLGREYGVAGQTIRRAIKGGWTNVPNPPSSHPEH